MKKSLFTLACLLTLLNLELSAQSRSAKGAMITLNGYSIDDANKMEDIHIKKNGDYTSYARTNVWFTKEFIASLDSLLNKEKAELSQYSDEITDGLRIYFADDALGHNILLVSTKSQGSNSDGDGIHQDYFRHDSTFLKIAVVNNGKVDHGNDPGAKSYQDLWGAFNCPANDNCVVTDDYIDCATALSWINNYSPNPSDQITETSEWFNLSVLDNINTELQSQTNGADGLRVYLAKKQTDGTHCFILVTTHKVGNAPGIDYYDCMSSTKSNYNHLKNEYFKFRLNRFESSNPSFKKLRESKKKTLSSKSYALYMKKYYLRLRRLFNSTDNGEQCPDNCDGVTWP